MTTNIQRIVSSTSFGNVFVNDYISSIFVDDMLTFDCFELVLFSRSM